MPPYMVDKAHKTDLSASSFEYCNEAPRQSKAERINSNNDRKTLRRKEIAMHHPGVTEVSSLDASGAVT
jgi:hypothetical protein